ncbi:AIM24 family protein [Fredinandcohnia sp. FSL W7-1320]|uniref:AIM24 family protein n=1 Tax=Fredinandcohnia sp. FSL W7-1320 TaxID=2954540 RepID=UPI0030FD64AE
MSKYSIAEFIKNTEQEDKGEGLFELETPRMLEVNLNGMIWAKAGSMVAYNGKIKYEREGILEHGLGSMFKKALTGEGASLMKANGQGKLYLADGGKKIIILQLQNESIYVNGNDLLAFEPSLKHEIKLMKRVAGMMAGGLFNVRCEGSGMLAITTHYEPLTLRVTPGKPVITDPNATVAWSGNLRPEFQTDISFKTFVGRGSGESIQMRFEGDGFVIVQPYEEVYMQQSNS